MNKRVTLTFAVALAALICIGIYLAMLFPANSTNNSKPETPKKTAEQNTTQPSAAAEPAPAPGKYTGYTEATYDDTTKGRRILFFHAPWCPQCRQLDKEITAAKLPDGVTIFKVDYDTSIQLRSKYGVTLQTTFVEVDAESNKLKSFVAYSEPTYANLSKQLAF